MDVRFEEAQALIAKGQRAEAIDRLITLLQDGESQPVEVYRSLLVQFYRVGRHHEGVEWADRALQAYPGDVETMNVKGVLLRRAGRPAAAAEVFNTMLKASPNSESILSNLGNAYNDMGDGASAAKVFSRLIRKQPRNAEYLRLLGVALRQQGARDQAISRFRQSVTVNPANVDAWCDLSGTLSENGQGAEALTAIEKAITLNPTDLKAQEARIKLLRLQNQLRAAEAHLMALLPEHDDLAWVHSHLGAVVSEYDRARGLAHHRRAVELQPEDKPTLFALAEALDRARGPQEARYLEESFTLLRNSMPPEEMTAGPLKIANEVYARLCAFDDHAALGTLKDIGRRFIAEGKHTALLAQMPRVRTDEDRLELLEQHRMWGELALATARNSPVRRPKTPRPPGKIRLGFMSSDLRRHPVAYFALPLFEHLDSERFEVYCYSFSELPSDEIQEFITTKATAFRWRKDLSAVQAAQMIADDQLDILIELGGSTHMNKLSVMAYRAAPLQASWLGYPHSAGLETIDHLITDPYNTPERADLLIETPLVMPKTWIALGRQVFRDDFVINPGIPQDKSGVVTFGTANNPYKLTREALQVWGQVMLRVPNSKMLFVRPEGASPMFRDNISKVFSDMGIALERIGFVPVRGAHMQHYNSIDISLDTFPLTGGTTTCEALWMGVPVVSLVGSAFYERLSYSILNNVELGDLCAHDVETFIDIAVRLAEDKARRTALRPVIRQRMTDGPLGQSEAFARDFYDLIAKAVEAARARSSAVTA